MQPDPDKKRQVFRRAMLAGLFFMFSLGAGLLAREEHGTAAGWLTFVLSVVIGSGLYRLVILLEENRIPDRTIRKWHRQIVADAESKLGRTLTSTERQLITSRGGCIALERIHDNIKNGTKEDIVAYLNQESATPSSQPPGVRADAPAAERRQTH